MLTRQNDGKLSKRVVMRMRLSSRQSLLVWVKRVCLGNLPSITSFFQYLMNNGISSSWPFAKSPPPVTVTQAHHGHRSEIQASVMTGKQYQCSIANCPERFDTLNEAHLHLSICPKAFPEDLRWLNDQGTLSALQRKRKVSRETPPAEKETTTCGTKRHKNYNGVRKLLVRASKSVVRPLLLLVKNGLLKTFKRKQQQPRERGRTMLKLPAYKGFYGGSTRDESERQTPHSQSMKQSATVFEMDTGSVGQQHYRNNLGIFDAPAELDEGAPRTEMDSSTPVSPQRSSRLGNVPMYIEMPSPAYSQQSTELPSPSAEDTQDIPQVPSQPFQSTRQSPIGSPADKDTSYSGGPCFGSTSGFQSSVSEDPLSRITHRSSKEQPLSHSINHFPAQSSLDLSHSLSSPFNEISSQKKTLSISSADALHLLQSEAIPLGCGSPSPKSQLPPGSIHHSPSQSPVQHPCSGQFPTQSKQSTSETELPPLQLSQSLVQPPAETPSPGVLSGTESLQAPRQSIPCSNQHSALTSGAIQSSSCVTSSSAHRRSDLDRPLSTSSLVEPHLTGSLLYAADKSITNDIDFEPNFHGDRSNIFRLNETSQSHVPRSGMRQRCETENPVPRIPLDVNRESSNFSHGIPNASNDNLCSLGTISSKIAELRSPDSSSVNSGVEIELHSNRHSRITDLEEQTLPYDTGGQSDEGDGNFLAGYEEQPLPHDIDERADTERDDDFHVSQYTRQGSLHYLFDDNNYTNEQEEGLTIEQREWSSRFPPQLPPIIPLYTDSETTVSHALASIYVAPNQNTGSAFSYLSTDFDLEAWLQPISDAFCDVVPSAPGPLEVEGDFGLGCPSVASMPAPTSTICATSFDSLCSDFMRFDKSTDLPRGSSLYDSRPLSIRHHSIEQMWSSPNSVPNEQQDFTLHLPANDAPFEETCLRDMGILHERSDMPSDSSSTPIPAQLQPNPLSKTNRDEHFKPNSTL